MADQPEYWFYHLEASPLEAVLPDLLSKTLGKGWRALVRFGDGEDLSTWDEFLWTYRQDSFLPHGREDQPRADQQPVLLANRVTDSSEFDALFLIDSAEAGEVEGLTRIMIMIDGRSETSVQAERKRWKDLKDKGASMSYWQQDERGRWAKKA